MSELARRHRQRQQPHSVTVQAQPGTTAGVPGLQVLLAAAAAPPTAPAHPALDLIGFDDYVAYRPHVFRSTTSGQWFLRQHREELVRSGALLRVCGRLMVQPKAFDDYILRIGKRQALSEAA